MLSLSVALDRKQRERVAIILTNVGTVAFGGIVIGYFVSPTPISFRMFFLGFVFSVVCFIIATVFDKER